MENGQNGGLMVAVVEPVGVVPKPGQEFATTRGPKTEVQNAAVLLAKMQSVTLKLAVSFRFDNYYLLDKKPSKIKRISKTQNEFLFYRKLHPNIPRTIMRR